jgi:hypothetical protein
MGVGFSQIACLIARQQLLRIGLNCTGRSQGILGKRSTRNAIGPFNQLVVEFGILVAQKTTISLKLLALLAMWNLVEVGSSAQELALNGRVACRQKFCHGGFLTP